MIYGEREEKDDPLIQASFKFVSNVKRLDSILSNRQYPNLHLITKIFEDETHVSVMPALFSMGLRAVFSASTNVQSLK